MKKNVFLLLLLVTVCSWGQMPYEELLAAREGTGATRSITRAWKDKAQITYIQNIEYDPYNADVMVSSIGKFVYYDPSEEEYRVAEFSNLYWPRVTDFEILEDTLYYCGYANTSASSTSPSYVGYIGYFCIPALFDGTDGLHTLVFNPQPLSLTGSPTQFLNEPCKIEVFKAGDGIHAICTGGWSDSPYTLYNGGHFVADVVHQFSTGDWWYYVHLGDGVEMFNDVAVTDNYVVTAAPKANNKYLYLRVYTKPQQVSLNPLSPTDDPTIFDVAHRTPPYQSYYFTWFDSTLATANASYLNICYPLLAHTVGDTFALAYLSYGWHNQDIYGTTVKVMDIADMLHAPPPGSGVVPIDIGGGGDLIPPDVGDTPVVPIYPPGVLPEPDPYSFDTLKLHYNRIIDIQDHERCPYPPESCHALAGMVYDSVSRSILVLQRQSYAYGYLDDGFAIDAFPIHQPTAPVSRYTLTGASRPLHSLSGGLTSGHFCLSGNCDRVYPDLLVGSMKRALSGCFALSTEIPTYYHSGAFNDVIPRPNWLPTFPFKRIEPLATTEFDAAFFFFNQPVTISSYPKEIICQP